MQPASELVSSCLVPPCQRVLDRDHVERLQHDMRADLGAHGSHSVLQSISVAVLPGGKMYVLDGQHRIAAFSSDEMRRDTRVMSTLLPVVVYPCADTADMMARYAQINHHLPIHPMELEVSWVEKTKPLLEMLHRRWRVYMSRSASPRCPNFSETALKTALQSRSADMSDARITGRGLTEDVDELNRLIISRLPMPLRLVGATDTRHAKCSDKQPSDPCFLGLWRDCGWLDLVLHRRLRSDAAWDALDVSGGSPLMRTDGSGGALSPAAHVPASRAALPRPVRRLVWSKCNDLNLLVGMCYVCEESITFDAMECAHDVPHCLGGESTVKNMWPACKGCNRDMGIRLLSEYRAAVRAATVV
jgi:hypothetical protein